MRVVEIMVERVYREKSRETPTSGDPEGGGSREMPTIVWVGKVWE